MDKKKSKRKRSTANFGKAICPCGKKFTKKTRWHENCSKACKYNSWIMRRAARLQQEQALSTK